MTKRPLSPSVERASMQALGGWNVAMGFSASSCASMGKSSLSGTIIHWSHSRPQVGNWLVLSQSVVLVVIGVGRNGNRRNWMGFQFLQNQADPGFKLSVF